MSEFLEYVQSTQGQILPLSWGYVELTPFSAILVIAIGVPLGILTSYLKKPIKLVLGTANIVQVVPDLALLGFTILLLRIGSKPAIFMVILYPLLSIIKNTCTGIQSISDQTLRVARGIGMIRAQIFTKVQVPMALPTTMAGMRTFAVTAVGLMTIVAFIGAGGLGYLVYSGIRTSNNMQILVGAVPACILALVIDSFMGILERMVVPEGLMIGNSQTNRFVCKSTKFTVSLLCFCLLMASVGGRLMKGVSKDALYIGNSDMSEQLVLDNMYADMIEAKTDCKVQRDLSLDRVQIYFSALQNGQIDMYVDYTGTLYGDILKMKSNSNADEVYRIMEGKIKEQYNLTLPDRTPFNDIYTFTVRKDTAEKYNLKTVSDLEKVPDRLTITPTPAFNNHKEALPGIKSKYPNMNFQGNTAMDGVTRYVAPANKESDVIDAYSTDGLIGYYDLVVLEDDKQYFLPYYGVSMISEHLLTEYPDAVGVISEFNKHPSSEGTRKLNYEVDVKRRGPAEVARESLVQKGPPGR